ncbi:MAG: sugar ABC transporter permease [Rhizobiales bacterium]|nr:sugar ABC transporter permease [Hyphomicrobiales bacterium]
MSAVAATPRSRHRLGDGVAYWLILPLLALEGLFLAYPILSGIASSFVNPDSGGYDFSNFSTMLADPDFWAIMIRTLVFVLLVDVAVLLTGLGVALLMNRQFRGRGVVRGLLTIPWAVPEVPVAITFIFMIDPTFGVFNLLARMLPGVTENPQWTLDPTLAMAIVVTVTVWKGFPFYSLVLLAALQAVPEELYEAARLDGASAWRQFRHVTLPGIRPSIALLAVLAFIYSMQQFTLIWLITGGGPVDATLTLAPAIYMQAFRFYNFEYAAAMAVVGLLFSVLATLAFISVQRRLALDER